MSELQGYKKDAQGRLIPIENISPIDLERDEFVQEAIIEALKLSQEIIGFKTKVFSDLEKFVKSSASKYKAKIGGSKGNITLFSFDGKYKITRQINETIAFDERLQSAKALIDECIEEWSRGSDENIKILINDAFSVNKQGKLDKKRILGLRRLKVKHPKWKRAMKAISESLQVINTKPYIRFYERDKDGQYQPIELNIAR